MIHFIKIVKDTDAARELNRAFKVADVQAIKVFSGLFEEGELISDIVRNLQNEHSFNTSEDICESGNFLGALRDVLEGIDETNEHKDNLERAYEELKREWEGINHKDGFTTLITTMQAAVQRFLKAQQICLKGDGLLPKIKRTGKLEYVIELVQCNDSISNVASKAGVPPGRLSSLTVRLHEMFSKINQDTTHSKAIMIAQNMDHLITQAVKSEGKRPIGTTKQPTRRVDRSYQRTPQRENSNDRAMFVGREEERGDRAWSEESIDHIIECFEGGKHKPSKGKTKNNHLQPPRYHHAMRAHRKRDGNISVKLKQELREKYKMNGRKYGCWSEWQEMDNRYFQDVKSDSPHHKTSRSTEAAASQEDDPESYLQEELTTLKEEMANMTKALAKAKDKKKKMKGSIDWGDSDDSGWSLSSSSDDESSEESVFDNSESEDES